MRIINFIKKKINLIKLRKNVNFLFKPYLKKSMDNIDEFNFVENPTDEIKNISASIASMPDYKDLNDKYIDLIALIEKHNREVERVLKHIDNFSLRNILANISHINLDEIISEYKEDYDVLVKAKLKKGKARSFREEYNELVENKAIISGQYLAREAYLKLTNEKIDKYLDYHDQEQLDIYFIKLKKEFDNKKKYFTVSFIETERFVNLKNNDYIASHKNTSLLDDVNGKSLDPEQREAVIKDEVANLVVAGAGSGKTLTICGKVKYLIEECGISKDDILLLSYSKKSATDLEKKISAMYDGMNVSTFHSLGLKILTYLNGKKYAIEEQFKAIIEKYFREDIYKRKGMLDKVLTFIAFYTHDIQSDKKFKSKGELYDSLEGNDFKTLRDLLDSSEEYGKKVTLKKEMVKSYEELAIANFYFINGINYEYERPYKIDTATMDKRQYTPDFYLPDYDIYHEHYGIDRNGRCTQYTEKEEEAYLKGIEWKRALHVGAGTKCIETYSYDFKEGKVLDRLEDLLKCMGVKLNRISDEEISRVINSVYNDVSFKSFINLVMSFINLYKSIYTSKDYFESLKKKMNFGAFGNARCELFLDICKDIYCYYEDTLKFSGKIDFDDMILKSIAGLDDLDGFKFKYIIVDEFQDISNSRMKFILKLLEHSGGKLFAVGDDFQSIYRFAGCDLNYFISFDEFFPKISTSFITSTHRNSQELQNIVVPFILRNPQQMTKKIKSNIHLDNPIGIMYYKQDRGNTLLNVLEIIHNKDNNAKVMLLGRNNMDILKYRCEGFLVNEKSLAIKCLKFPSLKIRFSTVHGSKGLEEDYVVLLNADDDIYGFPNKMEDDPILNLVLSSESGIEFSEERRLWYVALTRTKSYVYIIANIDKPSYFLDEIKDQCIILNQRTENGQHEILCPSCKTGRLILREANNGVKFYGCSHYPYCKYFNRDLQSVKNKRCPWCGDFLTFKRGSHGAFWGCHNYPNCTYTEPYRKN